ncbi:MAG: acyl-CoA/acyl-ACP dehydrogenase [Pirellulales bacterium]|nr:acyl-CoA/acyl-ACP dehydrogenase [Pirellulales bacterium]
MVDNASSLDPKQTPSQGRQKAGEAAGNGTGAHPDEQASPFAEGNGAGTPQKPESQNESAAERVSFAETAMRLGGKSEEEARRIGAVDRADEDVEALFAERYKTVNSPIHRAVWNGEINNEQLTGAPAETPLSTDKVMLDSLDVVRRRRDAGTLMDDNKKISAETMEELATVGYWGLLVDEEYGGSGAPFAAFAPFLTKMAMYDPTVAGLASVHGCIGAVDPLRSFGTSEQKKRLLPLLASGERLSAFALTEPGAGSDLTALKTTATRRGEKYVINGEKLFITNVVPGRMVGVVALIDGKPAVLVADLPPQENEHFQLPKYGLWALKHTHNQGMVFKDFEVPAENLLDAGKGDGLTIAYHGLNLGRVSLCANAAGTMRSMMANMIPWAQYRQTYGAPIANRELVQRRLGRLAGLIVATDALVDWCSTLLDRGYRGEMECIIAKIFGSEAQKEAAIELFMKTHGGRSFLHGHLFGDNVHEYLAPCIYEGEGEMLGMAFFKSLVKHHGSKFFQPIGETLKSAGIKKPNMANPIHAWKLRGPLWKYSKWYMRQVFGRKPKPDFSRLPGKLREHAEYAAWQLQAAPLEISGAMRKFQLKLADRQCRMSELSLRVQDAVVMLCTALYASRMNDELIRDAADIICRDLRRGLESARPSDRYFRDVTRLGEAIADGGFKPIAGLDAEEIMMPYE